MIEWTAVAVLLSAASMLASAGAWVYVHVSRRHHATEQEVRDVELRLAVAEARIGAAPSGEQVHELDRHVVALGGDIKALTATMEGFRDGFGRLAKMVDRHEDHLLGERGK